MNIHEKRSEYYRARDVAARLRREIREMEVESARAKLTKLSPHQSIVLDALAKMYGGEWHDWRYYVGYCRMCESSGLDRRQVRRALLALRRLGFAEYAKGLSNEDGEFAGAGWRISRDGDKWWREHNFPFNPR